MESALEIILLVAFISLLLPFFYRQSLTPASVPFLPATTPPNNFDQHLSPDALDPQRFNHREGAMGRSNNNQKIPPALWPDGLLAWKHGNTLYGIFVLLLYLITLSALMLGDIGRVRWGFIAVCIAILPALAEELTPVIFPWLMKWLITVPLVLHMAGGLYGFYFTCYPVYDKIAHLAASAALAFVAFEVILIVSRLLDARPSRFTVMAWILGLVLFFALGWEYAEYNIDSLSGSTFFLSFEDSVADMAFNLLGTGIVLYWVSRYMQREPFEKVMRRFVRTKYHPDAHSL